MSSLGEANGSHSRRDDDGSIEDLKVVVSLCETDGFLWRRVIMVALKLKRVGFVPYNWWFSFNGKSSW